MLQIAIDAELERVLAAVAERTGDTPEMLARRALEAYLADLEDYATAVEAWREFEQHGRKSVSLEEMVRTLDVAG